MRPYRNGCAQRGCSRVRACAREGYEAVWAAREGLGPDGLDRLVGEGGGSVITPCSHRPGLDWSFPGKFEARRGYSVAGGSVVWRFLRQPIAAYPVDDECVLALAFGESVEAEHQLQGVVGRLSDLVRE